MDRFTKGYTAACIVALFALVILSGLRIGQLDASIGKLEGSRPSVVLRYDTPVLHEWKDVEGNVVGTYTQSLYDYTHADKTALSQARDISDIKYVIHAIVSNPVKRGILVRHDMTAAQLDALARRFQTTASSP
jgi:hypothetical protein